MIGGRPLYDNAADAEYFVEPPGFATALRAVERGFNVAVLGDRGGGKTTFLRQLERLLRDQDDRPVFVEATAITDPAALASRIRDALAGRPSRLTEQAQDVATLIRTRPPAPGGASRALIAEIESVNAAEASTMLVDASGSAAAVQGLFGRMRDHFWQGAHRWIVAVDQGERSTALAPPADAFFDVVVRLPPVEDGLLLELLRRRAPDVDEDVLGSIAEGARGNPRTAIRGLTGMLVSDTPPHEAFGRAEALRRRARELGQPQAALFDELLDRGQASASDRELQAVLAVSRARLAQMLRDLLEAEVVEAQSAASTGPGRPRTVYRPVDRP